MTQSLFNAGEDRILGAMVVPAAAESGCDVLWTDDLNEHQGLRGGLTRDPFANAE